MALCLTQSEVESTIENSSNAISAIRRMPFVYNFLHPEENLAIGGFAGRNTQIERLRDKEKLFCRALGCGTLEEVNVKLTDLRTKMESIKNLNGPLLERTFLRKARLTARLNLKDPQKRKVLTGKAGYTEEELRIFNEKLIAALDSKLKVQVDADGNPKNNKEIKDVLDAELRSLLDQGFREYGFEGGRYISTKIGASADIARLLSVRMFNKAEDIIRQSEGESWRKDIKLQAQSALNKELNGSQISLSLNPNLITRGSDKDLSSITYAMSGSEVREMYYAGLITDSDLIQIRSELRDFIINQSGIMDYTFSSILEDVLEKNEFGIFMGQNIAKGMNGLLGEIQGKFILQSLLGKGYEDSQIIWQGALNNPHEDLIFNIVKENVAHGLGIQIKNTTWDLDKTNQFSVNFAKKTFGSSKRVVGFDDMKDQINNNEIYENLISAYQLKSFNISYEMDHGKAVAQSNGEFDGTRARILQLCNQADALFGIMAGALMFLSITKELEQTGLVDQGQEIGNSIFLVGGQKFFSAASILTQIFEEAEKVLNEVEGYAMSSFNISAEVGKGFTIVDYINAQKDEGKRNEIASAKTVLTSSFIFDFS